MAGFFEAGGTRLSIRHLAASSVAASALLAALTSVPAGAEELLPALPLPTQAFYDLSNPGTDPQTMGPHADHAMDMSHGTTPAGVLGANMIGAGKVMLDYTPMFMHMDNNYIGSSVVSPQTIVTTVPSSTTMMMMGMPMQENYRIVPTSMDTQMHMFHVMYGVTDWLNLMVMSSYEYKSMNMTTFAGATGTTILGQTTQTSQGFGDTSVMSLWRLYQDSINHVHLNLGLSLPSGSTTETMTMLSPMGTMMTMRGSYGMQLGTGTVDLLPGLTYTGHLDQWSWGAAYRGRVALDTNSEGYYYGYQHELTGWGGYTWLPGFTTTARIAGSEQDVIHGSDPMISGLMQGTNPLFYGGKRINLFGGIEFSGAPYGLGNTHVAIEAGGPVYQDLNGPQLGQAWQISGSIGIGF
jgi:hypothetical protein